VSEYSGADVDGQPVVDEFGGEDPPEVVAVNVSPANSGRVCARAKQGRCSMRWMVWVDRTARDVPSFRWNENGMGLLQTRSCLS
jgi:hypothetical protein